MHAWLVTGGAGFIGANFVLAARRLNVARIINLDLLTYAGHPENLATLQGDGEHVFVHGDIGDQALVAGLLTEHRPTAIVNFAAESHVDRSILGPQAFIETNIVGTHTLLAASLSYWQGLTKPAREDFRFLHVSTDEVYGSLSPAAPAFTEVHQYQPNSPYAASKAAADHLVRAYHHTYGLPVLTTNCSSTRKSSSRSLSRTRAPASRCPSTAMASRCATGCLSRITARPFERFWRRAGRAKHIISVAMPSGRI
jgi:dTDP-glucose 4,6-dehydratase